MIMCLKGYFIQPSRFITAVAVLSIVIPAILSDKYVCPKKKGYFPVVGSSCTAYFICKDWKPIAIRPCEDGEHFNPGKQVCEPEEFYPCFERPKSKECPRPNGRFLKPNSKCRKYIDCCDGIPKEKKCGKYLLFDATTGRCNYEELVDCKERPKSKECPRPNGRFLKPNSKCKKYFDCRDGIPKEKRCDDYLLFDIASGRCDYEDFVDCREKDDSKESSSNESSESTETTDESTVSNKLSTDQSTSTYKKTSKESSSESNESGSKENSIETTDDTTGTIKISTDYLLNNMTTPDNVKESTTEEIDIKSSSLQELTSDNTESVSVSLENSSTTEESTILEMSSTTYIRETSSPIITSETIPEKVTMEPTDDVFSKSDDSKESTTEEHFSEIIPEESSTDFPTEEPPESTTSELIDSKEEKDSKESTTEKHFSEIIPKESSTEFPTEEPPESTTSELTTEQTSTETSDVTSSYLDVSTSKPNIVEIILSTKFSTPNDNFGSPDPLEYFVCPEPTGYFPHPYDRHKFIGCVHNIPSIMDCPSNLVYDHKARQCVYK